MKKLSLLLVTLLIASVSFAYADDDNTWSTDDNQESTTNSEDSTMTWSGKTIWLKIRVTEKVPWADCQEISDKLPNWWLIYECTVWKNIRTIDLNQRKQEMEMLNEQKKQEIEANKEKIKANNEAFKEERKSIEKPVLTDEQKAELKSIMDSHKVQADEIKKTVEAGTLTRDEAALKLEALRNSTYESVKALLWNDELAQKLLWMKKETMEKNKELRDDNKEIRQDFKQQREDLRVKYKEQFTKAVWSRLDKMDQTKLQTVLTRIDAAIAKVEANTNLSQTNKDKLLAQLNALKDLINEKLGNTSTEDSIDVDALLQ